MVAQLATNFPDSLDVLSNPNGTSSLSNPSHAQQHSNANDAIEALQTKVGIDGSLDPNSIDYRVSALEDGGGQLGVELGLAGNNDLTISGIENKTAVDTFSKSVYSTIRYTLQIRKNDLFVSEQIDIINDGTNLNVNRYEVSSNTNDSLYTLQLEENAGIISLSVTPTSGSITARYYRTALKS
jgi:hypothetical protein